MRMYDFLSPTFFAINYVWVILRSVGKHLLVLTPHPSPNKKTLSLSWRTHDSIMASQGQTSGDGLNPTDLQFEPLPKLL